MRLAEATCVSMIKTARATEEEMQTATPASVQRWAACGLTNSERDVHRVVKSQRLALPIPLTRITVQNRTFPFIRSIDWLNFLVTEAEQWHRLAGLKSHEPGKPERVWSSFWAKFRALEPDHDIFNRLNEEELCHTAAGYFHLDEGRGLKRTAIMIMSFHSALGFGFSRQGPARKRKKHEDDRVSLAVNYVGATLTNRFLLAVIPKKYYEKTPLVLNDVLDLVGKGFSECLEEGVVARDGRRLRLCILGVKADWPAQVRCAGLIRSYNHGPKRKQSKTADHGVCHLCEAGSPGIPFEDIGSQQPLWAYTCGASLPWLQTPELLRHLPFNPVYPASFFCIDPWHTVHMGIGKSFISCSMTLVLHLLPGRGIPSKLESLTASYHAWCKRKGISPFISRITKDTLTWKKIQDEPAGAWNKGNLTSLFCRWFEDFCHENSGSIEAGSMLQHAAQAAGLLNSFLRSLYNSDAFIPGERAISIACDGRGFLRLYRTLAEQAFCNKRALFPLLPKVHSMDHLVMTLAQQGRIKGFALNPMILGNQMEEDFIGRPSRISRRVSPRLPATRSLQRYLIAARTAWVQAGMIR